MHTGRNDSMPCRLTSGAHGRCAGIAWFAPGLAGPWALTKIGTDAYHLAAFPPPFAYAMGVQQTLERVFDNIFHEGVNSQTHNVMNWVFYGLFVTLVLLLIVTGGNIHVAALLLLSLALFLSINWYVTVTS